MEEASFHRASVNDLEEFYEIELECFDVEAFSKQRFFELLTSPTSISIKATLGSKIIGFVIGDLEGDHLGLRATFQTLDVLPPFRRKRIAFNLMASIEIDFRERGCPNVVLQTRVGNSPAIKLFTKLGFSKTGLLPNYYAAGISAYEMIKNLS